MRTLGSLITAGPQEPVKAIRLVSAACRAYAHAKRPFDIEREQIVVTDDGAFVGIRQGLRSKLHGAIQFHMTRVRNAILRQPRLPPIVPPRTPNEPLIIVTHNEISIANPAGARNVYELGTMLWELLAGRRLLAVDILREGNPPPLPHVSPDLHVILRKAVSFDLANRQTPVDLADALDDYLCTVS